MLSDLYARWIRPNASQRHYLIAGKICMIIILSLAVVIVFRVHIMFDVAVFMLQLSAAELPANWAQWWWWRFNGKARIAASFGGAAIFCLVVLGPRFASLLGLSLAPALEIAWWWQTFIVMGLTTILWVAVALFTDPEPDFVLDKFYTRVKPLGSWAPVKARTMSRSDPPFESNDNLVADLTANGIDHNAMAVSS
jgi:Na+/proline symporter